MTGSSHGRPARRARIAELIAHHPVRSQPELATLLAENGFQVTQATLSRDLEEISSLRTLLERHPTGRDAACPCFLCFPWSAFSDIRGCAAPTRLLRADLPEPRYRSPRDRSTRPRRGDRPSCRRR